MTLDELKPGEMAEIISFDQFTQTAMNRLNVMGVNRGSIVYIDPTVVTLKHNQCFICDDIEFCLRYDDTKKIEIKKV